MERQTPAHSPHSVEVTPASAHSYPVVVGRGWEKGVEELLSSLGTGELFVFSQKGLESMVLEGFQRRFNIPENRIILLEQGETNKHIKNLAPVYNRLIEEGADRNSVLVALGGGVVGDFVGFVAATLLRGVRFVQLPSTLLAAVDSSVGGKVAVNVDRGKNMVGAFHHPEFVYFNVELLRTLPGKEWKCGLAEMVKHAFLDPEGLAFFERTGQELLSPDSESLVEAVLLSVLYKAKVVSHDEKETGLRSILNLGHTTAHAIESLTHYSVYSHGEAVSRGLATMLILSRNLAGLAPEQEKRLLSLLTTLELPVDTAGYSAEELLNHMKYDKKNREGESRFVLLQAPGVPLFNQRVPPEEFLRAWNEQKERFG